MADSGQLYKVKWTADGAALKKEKEKKIKKEKKKTQKKIKKWKKFGLQKLRWY